MVLKKQTTCLPLKLVWKGTKNSPYRGVYQFSGGGGVGGGWLKTTWNKSPNGEKYKWLKACVGAHKTDNVSTFQKSGMDSKSEPKKSTVQRGCTNFSGEGGELKTTWNPKWWLLVSLSRAQLHLSIIDLLVIPSHVSSWGYKNGPVCVLVWVYSGHIIHHYNGIWGTCAPALHHDCIWRHFEPLGKNTDKEGATWEGRQHSGVFIILSYYVHRKWYKEEDTGVYLWQK